MKKLDTNKLTDKQADLFKNNLVYIATVDENGNPQVGPKGSMTVLDPSHMPVSYTHLTLPTNCT